MTQYFKQPGAITLTTKSDEGSNWVIELTPEVLKRYNYAF